LNTLARDVVREESLREVKDVQRQYSQLSQFGNWWSMASLFADDGTVHWGDATVTGRGAIASWLQSQAGAMDGRTPGSLHTDLSANPVVNLSADGLSAQARWTGLQMLGDGNGGTRIDGGIYENDYVLEHGRWKIADLNFTPLYDGDFGSGWKIIVGKTIGVVPYHFDATTAGVPIPAPAGPAPRTHLSAAQLAARIARLNDEDSVRNLQDSYGYYVDQRMWTDVTDLFVPEGTVTIDGVGTFRGRHGVRQAMERTMGPEGLTQGIMNDHPMFDTIVDVLPGGRVAIARGTEIGMLGDASSGAQSWQFSVFRNTFVKQGGLWKLRAVHITPLLTANYADGWGTGGVTPQRHTRVPAYLDISRQAAAAWVDRTAQRGRHSSPDVADLTRRLDRSEGYDGAANVESAYAAVLNDLRFDLVGDLTAEQGFKSSPLIGYYVGPERIAKVGLRYGPPPEMRSFLAIHWLVQPVILVSHDGRSANIRTRLFQYGASLTGPSGFATGNYDNQMVLVDGVWKAWSISIDESYVSSVSWAKGWSAAIPRDPNEPPPPPSSVLTTFPPDLALRDMGAREAGFAGGTGQYLVWPDILPMWFPYRNLVSGAVPPHYQGDCSPCVARPDWSMTNFGYELPPNGPSIDGLNVDPGLGH
jgi:hypothetical protein